MEARGTLFREIHKNTWLKRLTVDNKKITVGPKKSDRSWVVFCVHDDCEAILEGYAEPRQAASHVPEWTVALQNALHISHALIPSEHEYEFVITLASDVVRFNAASWEIMHEWVETLRQKLREMKILSPKENLYSKLPEIRPPLLPTRDPTSPLPAPPPVPAALVPGVERIPAIGSSSVTATTSQQPPITSVAQLRSHADVDTDSISIITSLATPSIATVSAPVPTTASMSNTLTQNLINMLSNPVSAYSNHLSTIGSDTSSTSLEDSFFFDDDQDLEAVAGAVLPLVTDEGRHRAKKELFNKSDNLSSLAKTFADNVLADPNTCSSSSSTGLGAGTTALGLDGGCSSSSINDAETSSIDSATSAVYKTEPIVIPRPHTSRSSAREHHQPKRIAAASHSVPLATPSTSTPAAKPLTPDEMAGSTSTNITIIQVSSPLHVSVTKTPSSSTSTVNDVFSFPTASQSSTVEKADDNFKSNVQIIPSNYSAPTFNTNPSHRPVAKARSNVQNDQQVTTVQVSGATSLATGYGKIIKSSIINTMANPKLTPKPQPSKNSCAPNTSGSPPNQCEAIRNFGAVTNIPIGSSPVTSSSISTPSTTASSTVQLHYEQVFVTPSASSVSVPSTSERNGTHNRIVVANASTPKHTKSVASQAEVHINRINLQKDTNNHRNKENNAPDIGSTTTGAAVALATIDLAMPSTSSAATNHTAVKLRNNQNSSSSGKIVSTMRENLPSPLPAIRKLLTRGLTEATISRPSRREPNTVANRGRSKNTAINNHVEAPAGHAENSAQNDSREHRRRSSSHSDTQGIRSRTINSNVAATPGLNDSRRMQPPPQPFRAGDQSGGPSGSRLTLREKQVLELRKEMMHSGGVRIQLRRKDCIGSMALVDAFGAVWISGWKQKDYPMLYNALHIGDQLVTVAGVNISCAADANKIIRNTASLYIELILRRVPFGRVYAIRREMDGQCLGLIRDGNTATIVDVVPKSLSARHGLPPKAQSCDGLSLTFWVLTEVNGRPLNLFFKENEVRDRLNAVGRDISILVQPSDLIVKLKKQLKSLRSHKDYIVQ